MSLFRRIQRGLHFRYKGVLWQINRRLRKSVTVETKQGVFTLPLDMNDPISVALYLYGEYELDLVTSVISFLRTSQGFPSSAQGTVLDIGANNGIISIGMLVSEQFDKAIAIEPDPRNFSYLQHNVEQNNLAANFICQNCAESDAKSTLNLELSDSNYGDHRIKTGSLNPKSNELFNESKRRVIQVQSDKIDELLEHVDEAFKTDIRIIWIDVQGYEGYVFLGARALLSRDIPVVSEIWPYGIQRAGMSQETFCNIAGEIWSAYWVNRRKKFIKYPIDTLHIFFDEVGSDGDEGNVIFTK